MITVGLPSLLCAAGDHQSAIVLEEPCETVGDALIALGKRSPGALDRIMDERGNVRRHVNVFVNEESIRFLDGLRTPTPDGSTILVIAAISGG